MSREEVMKAIVECSEKLGHVPSRPELMQNTQVSLRAIRSNFGSYTQALRACNLEREGNKRVGMDALFPDWAGVVRKLQRLPSIAEYELHSRYTYWPLNARFGSWLKVPEGLKKYLEDRGEKKEWKDVLEIIEGQKPGPGYTQINRVATESGTWPKILPDRPIYGTPMGPYPLSYGPVNEAGVILLFGARAEKLGFIVTRIQAEFPDCEAMRQVGEDKWQPVLIELENESKNFLLHRHDARKCDLIVCWKHNWPACPLEVVELKTGICHHPATKPLTTGERKEKPRPYR
jgi:hypothetical protein